MLNNYPLIGTPTPGEWDHIARECVPCGQAQSVYARPRGSVVPFVCVRCALLVLETAKLVTGED